MLRIQNNSIMCTTAFLLVFHGHIFLLNEPRAVRQREGGRLQKFPFSARKTLSKNHRGWRLLSHHTFQTCKEERSSWLSSFLLLPLLGSFNIIVCPQASLQQGTLEAQRVRYSALLDAWSWMWSPLHRGLAPLYSHILSIKTKPDREKNLYLHKEILLLFQHIM